MVLSSDKNIDFLSSENAFIKVGGCGPTIDETVVPNFGRFHWILDSYKALSVLPMLGQSQRPLDISA